MSYTKIKSTLLMEPLVSVITLSYNHEKYLSECLNGLIMQKTSFPYECFVHDDASTDNSASIIKSFAEKAPNIISPFYESENLYSKKDGSLNKVIKSFRKGKYIAFCEGDDYWTNPDKLQKQVDFLENNPEYSMCFHNAIEHYEDGSQPDHQFSNVEDRDYSGKEIYEHWIVPTASVVLRKDALASKYYQELISNPNFCYGDILMWISCAKMGKIRGMSDVMSVYRNHFGSALYTTPSWSHCYHHYEMYKSAGEEYKEIGRRLFFNSAPVLFFGNTTTEQKKKLFTDCWKINPVKTIYRFAQYFLRYRK